MLSGSEPRARALTLLFKWILVGECSFSHARADQGESLTNGRKGTLTVMETVSIVKLYL